MNVKDKENNDLIGLIPAAGKGSRLGLPYPKELYPIISKKHYTPVSELVLDHLIRVGVSHTVFVINETKHQLISYFGSGKRFACDISYVYQEHVVKNNQESTSPGLADAINSAYHLVKDKTVVFGMADTIILPEDAICFLYNQFSNNNSDITLGLFPTDNASKFGMVEFDKDKLVSKIVDKPNHTDLKFIWGCIVWGPRFTNFIKCQIKDGENDFAVILNNAIKNNLKIIGEIIPFGQYFDLGTFEEIMQLDQLIHSNK